MLIPALLLAAVQAAPAATACPAGTTEQALTCKAVEHQAGGQYAEAAEAFEALAASLSEGEAKRDRALAAAGNMWIAADQPQKAALALDKALAGTGLQAEQRGQALLDRARAAEAQDELKSARDHVNKASAILSGDPFLWYFSAALAIREDDPAAAKQAIDRALMLAPDDPLILFEAGHVAHFGGNLPAARAYWLRAAELDPEGQSGKSAREALALLESGESVQSEPHRSR